MLVYLDWNCNLAWWYVHPSLPTEAAAQGTDTSQGANPKAEMQGAMDGASVDPNGYDP